MSNETNLEPGSPEVPDPNGPSAEAGPPAAPSAITQKPYKWGFLSSSAVVLFLIIVGEAVGRLASGLPTRVSEGGLQARDWMTIAFAISTLAWVFLSRAAIARYCRSMQTGVALVSFSTIAVIIGVLIPQIDGFEDPEQRVFSKAQTVAYEEEAQAQLKPLVRLVEGRELSELASSFPDRDASMRNQILEVFEAVQNREYMAVLEAFDGSNPALQLEIWNVWSQMGGNIASFRLTEDALLAATQRERHFKAFKWAEGYFLYHCLHLYGFGMPPAEVPPGVLDSLDRFEKRYGIEERDNREKRMRASLSGGEKSREIGEFIYANESALRKFFDIATALQLNRAYKSAWFATLMGLLGIAVLYNTFRGPARTWVSMQRVGHFVTHLGILTLLVGGGVSKLQTSRGILHLRKSEGPKDEFWLHYDMDKRARLPFYLGLEKFARKEWMQLEVAFPDENFMTRPPTWTLWPGRTIDLDYGADGNPKTRLVVKELYDRAYSEPAVREMEDPSETSFGPMVGLDVTFGAMDDDMHQGHDHASDEQQMKIWRSPMDRNLQVLPDLQWQFRVSTAYDNRPPEAVVEDFPQSEGALGILFAYDKQGTDVREKAIPIELGGTYETPGGYRVEIRNALANYHENKDDGSVILDGKPLGAAYPENPAVNVFITPPGDGHGEERWVRQSVDAQDTGLQQDYTFSELLLYLVWDEWKAPGPPRSILHWGPNQPPSLVFEDGRVRPVELGQALPLPGPSTVVPSEFLANAVADPGVRFVEPEPTDPDAVDDDFYAREMRGLVLEVITDPENKAKAKSETLEMVTDGDLASRWRSPDDRIALRFFENTALMPYEWRSVLQVYEKDPETGQLVLDERGLPKTAGGSGPERSREIRVNDYFYWDGYRFFQTNANAADPDYSGIGVVYDPGIPVVLAGMYTIIAGTLLAFIIRPIAKSRKKKRATA